MMKRLFATLLLLAIALPAYARQPLRTIEGIVTHVSDGDTIHVTDALGTKVKVRFYGVDAPETEKGNKRTGQISKPGQPYGEESFQALRAKIERQRVTLQVYDIDRYQRAVAIVMLGNRDINREMVTEGHAWAYRQYLDRAHASEYIGAEEQARKRKMGLWRQSNPQPPWEFRRMLKSED